ncbi:MULTISPECIES: hypothetical protein [Amycolatopsis]|uniref:hypothetical protein n=1 Tax=Amycolatopsis TaxID=1813 RepID=UPI0033BD2D66
MSRRWLLVFPVLFALALVTLPLYGEALFEDEPVSSEPAPVLPPNPCPVGRPDAEVRHPNAYTDRAAPYSGSGVHPVLFVNAGDGVGDVGRPYDTWSLRVPVEWDAEGEPESAVQLIVCEYAVSAGEVATTCTYGGAHEVDFLRTSYAYRVFEARTSRPVAEFTLESGDVCPSSVSADNGGRPDYRMLQSPREEDLVNALRPLVET